MKARLAEGARLPDFVSGHIPARLALEAPNRSDFVVFTFLRDPIPHVISHLKWCKSLGQPDRKHLIESHPEATKALCAFLHETDLNDVQRLRHMMDTMAQARRFFDNCQTRYLTSQPAEYLTPDFIDVAKEVVESLDYIGLSETVSDDLTKVLAIAGWTDRPAVPFQNVAPLAEMPNMSNPEVAEFYEGLVILDRALYVDCAMRRFFTDPFNPPKGGTVVINNDRQTN